MAYVSTCVFQCSSLGLSSQVQRETAIPRYKTRLPPVQGSYHQHSLDAILTTSILYL